MTCLSFRRRWSYATPRPSMTEREGNLISEARRMGRIEGDARTRGGCMCGAVRYEGIGEPLWVGYCHCRSCRHHSGAAVAGMLVFKQDCVRFVAGKISIYKSSPGIERGFCGRCGTSITWKGHGLISLHIGTLDDPNGQAPTLHWRYEERAPWCDIGLDLPQVEMVYPTFPDE